MLKLNIQFFGGRGSSGSRNSGGAITTEKELVEAVSGINPGYKADSNAYDKDGYNNNCVKCAIAFEAKMRGEDVEANPFKFGNSEDLNKSRAYEKAFNNPETWMVGRNTKEKTIREINLTMTQDFGVGSRAIIQENTAGRRHTMNVVNLGGKVIVVDSQSGKYGSLNTMLKGIQTNHMSLTRTDNVSMNKEYQKWAYRPRSKK